MKIGENSSHDYSASVADTHAGHKPAQTNQIMLHADEETLSSISSPLQSLTELFGISDSESEEFQEGWLRMEREMRETEKKRAQKPNISYYDLQTDLEVCLERKRGAHSAKGENGRGDKDRDGRLYELEAEVLDLQSTVATVEAELARARDALATEKKQSADLNELVRKLRLHLGAVSRSALKAVKL